MFWFRVSCISCLLQIAAKIGGDGVAPSPTTNEFGYGGQKRPLEDAGELLVTEALRATDAQLPYT